MTERTIRALAAFSTVLVLAAGSWWNRGLFLETQNAGMGWAIALPDGQVSPAAPVETVVDAGPGVRVHVVGVTGSDQVEWNSRAWFAHASIWHVAERHIVARCEERLPVVSRCAIWLSVSAPTAQDRIRIIQRPGSLVDGAVGEGNVTIEQVR